MRVVLQKVKKASVSVGDKTVGAISLGFLVFLGVSHDDMTADADWMVEKILKLRLFSESDETFMEKNIVDVGGSILVVSQFTLYGDCRKGTRPSFTSAAKPEHAQELYEYVTQKFKESDLIVETGEFGAKMSVELINDGPVTLFLDH